MKQEIRKHLENILHTHYRNNLNHYPTLYFLLTLSSLPSNINKVKIHNQKALCRRKYAVLDEQTTEGKKYIYTNHPCIIFPRLMVVPLRFTKQF